MPKVTVYSVGRDIALVYEVSESQAQDCVTSLQYPDTSLHFELSAGTRRVHIPVRNIAYLSVEDD